MEIFYGFAAVFAIAFGVGVYRDRRRFRNGVLGGLALACLLLGLLGEVTRLDPEPLDLATWMIALTMLAAVLVLAVFLLINGVVMLRREGRRPANLLSLLAGCYGLALPALPLVAQYSDNQPLSAVAVFALALSVYVSFLFACYLGYSLVYRGIGARPGVDFVVVLGSGLIRGEVPPLLASRLDRAIAVRDAEVDRGGSPILIASGGQGPDEPRPEAHAMAEYIVGHGVGEDGVIREDRSRTTRENLEFSKAIMTERAPGHRCVIVTNDYHAFRAALFARATGVNGHVVGARTARYYLPSATIREFVAILVEHRWLNAAVAAAWVAFTLAVLVF